MGNFDYYPFGMLMPERQYAAGTGYRYGFNGKENDNEVKGEGNQQDYGMRIYDPRLGRFLSVDPLDEDYPELTPYQFASDTPIRFEDLDGLEAAARMSDGSIFLPAGRDNLGFKYPQGSTMVPNCPGCGKIEITKEDVSLALDIIPGVGTFKGLIESISGKDLITGEKKSIVDRVLGVLPYLGKAKKFIKVVKSTDKINEVKKASKAINKIDDVKATEKAIVNTDATKNRVTLRKDVKEKIKINQPVNEKGQMIDPNTKQPLDPNRTDVGHKPGQEWTRRKEMHKEKGSSRAEVIEEENDPDLYQLEDRSNNRSHKFEKKKSSI